MDAQCVERDVACNSDCQLFFFMFVFPGDVVPKINSLFGLRLLVLTEGLTSASFFVCAVVGEFGSGFPIIYKMYSLSYCGLCLFFDDHGRWMLAGAAIRTRDRGGTEVRRIACVPPIRCYKWHIIHRKIAQCNIFGML